MKLLASGRDGDIFEFAPGLVLRKTHDGRSIADEARHDPVRGRSTAIRCRRRRGAGQRDRDRDGAHRGPDDGRRHACGHPGSSAPTCGCSPICTTSCTRSRRRTGSTGCPTTEPVGATGSCTSTCIPINVIMSPKGPVVIDWPNARRGNPMTDVAVSYALIRCGRIPLPRPVAAVLNTVRRARTAADVRAALPRPALLRPGRADGGAQVLRREHDG